MRSLTRSLSVLTICLSATACEPSWMEQTVVFHDGLKVTLQHRAFGTFRTIAANRSGSVLRDYETGHDSRHVSIYRSPTGRLVVADYNTVPFIVGFDENRVPRLADLKVLQTELRLSNRWRYLGSVHRTKTNGLSYYPYEEECQAFGTGYIGVVTRRTKPCEDSNYTSG